VLDDIYEPVRRSQSHGHTTLRRGSDSVDGGAGDGDGGGSGGGRGRFQAHSASNDGGARNDDEADEDDVDAGNPEGGRFHASDPEYVIIAVPQLRQLWPEGRGLDVNHGANPNRIVQHSVYRVQTALLQSLIFHYVEQVCCCNCMHFHRQQRLRKRFHFGRLHDGSCVL
jgi:hypothetical protein